MNEKPKLIITVIAGAIIGLLVSMTLMKHGMGAEMSEQAMDHETAGMHGEMDGMMQGLDGKTGDAFDQAFLSEMITHHQGAVQMAQAALQNAKHQEIKDLAQKIVDAQNSEITQMQSWQKQWYAE